MEGLSATAWLQWKEEGREGKREGKREESIEKWKEDRRYEE